MLTKALLDCAIEEMRHVASGLPKNGNLRLVSNTPGGNSLAALRFLDAVLGNERMRCLAERAEVKIYEAHSAAALLAFALGSERELSADGTIEFHLGETTVRVCDQDHFDQDGRLATWIVEEWQKYRTAVSGVMKRMGLASDQNLQAEFWASGRLDLPAQECLRRGLVSRLF